MNELYRSVSSILLAVAMQKDMVTIVNSSKKD